MGYHASGPAPVHDPTAPVRGRRGGRAQLPAGGCAVRRLPAVAVGAAGPAGTGPGRAPLRARPAAGAGHPGRRGPDRARAAAAGRDGRSDGLRAPAGRSAGRHAAAGRHPDHLALLAAGAGAGAAAGPAAPRRPLDGGQDQHVGPRRARRHPGRGVAGAGGGPGRSRARGAGPRSVRAGGAADARAGQAGGSRRARGAARRQHAAAGRRSLPARPGAGRLFAGRYAGAGLPRHQPLDAVADGGGGRRDHAAAAAGGPAESRHAALWRFARWRTIAPTARWGWSGGARRRLVRRSSRSGR